MAMTKNCAKSVGKRLHKLKLGLLYTKEDCFNCIGKTVIVVRLKFILKLIALLVIVWRIILNWKWPSFQNALQSRYILHSVFSKCASYFNLLFVVMANWIFPEKNVSGQMKKMIVKTFSFPRFNVRSLSKKWIKSLNAQLGIPVKRSILKMGHPLPLFLILSVFSSKQTILRQINANKFQST